MIGYLKGKIIEKNDDKLLIDVSGVGYEVNIPVNLETDKEETELFVYTHVREDQLSLFGFRERETMEFFKSLLSVSGIGPKVALAIVGSAPLSSLKSSIAKGDASLLSAVSGVGKKTAEKAIIELRGRMGTIDAEGVSVSEGAEEVVDALMGLGFQRNEIIEGLKRVSKDIDNNDDKIKWLIKNLGRK